MEEWHFADILMISIVCAIIYTILALVNRAAGKKQKIDDGMTNCETTPENGEITEDN